MEKLNHYEIDYVIVCGRENNLNFEEYNLNNRFQILPDLIRYIFI